MITTKYLWKDGIHLQDLFTSILSKNFIEFVNNYLFSNLGDTFWLNESNQTNDFDSDIDGLINLRKTCQNNPLIGINSLREKIVSLREVLSKASFDILCVDETKLDASFPDHQFKYQGINSHQLEEIVILREGGIVFVRKGFLVKQMKNFETENPEAICLELVIAKKKWCILFAYWPLDTNKTMFLMKSILLWVKYLASMTTFS